MARFPKLKKNPAATTDERKAQEFLAQHIANAILLVQQKWTQGMKVLFSRLPNCYQRAMFVLFVAIAFVSSCCFIHQGMVKGTKSSTGITSIKKPGASNSFFKRNRTEQPLITKEEWQRMDSLKNILMERIQYFQSHRTNDSLLVRYQGLMDSLLYIETNYQSQLKK